MGEQNFEHIAANIVGYSNDERVRARRVKHSNDMDVDNLDAHNGKQGQEGYAKYVAELEGYYYSEDHGLSWLGNGKGWFGKGSAPERPGWAMAWRRQGLAWP